MLAQGVIYCIGKHWRMGGGGLQRLIILKIRGMGAFRPFGNIGLQILYTSLPPYMLILFLMVIKYNFVYCDALMMPGAGQNIDKRIH